MEGLGSSEAAASPTFSLVHEHADGRLPACHFDFYRLKDESELIGIGWEEYLDGETVLIVEWANLFPEALPEETSWLLLEHEGSCLRRVSLAPDPKLWENALSKPGLSQMVLCMAPGNSW